VVEAGQYEDGNLKDRVLQIMLVYFFLFFSDCENPIWLMLHLLFDKK